MTRWIRYLLYLGIFLAALGVSAYMTTRIVVRGKPEVTVPDLTGTDTVSALNELAKLGLNLRVQGFDYSPRTAKDRIMDQDPVPGMKVKGGRDIRVVLSKGPREKIVPELEGLSLEQARSILLQSEIELGQVSYVYSEKAPEANRVLAQVPAASTEIDQEAKVDLLVSQGSRNTALILPDYTGQNYTLALLKLEEAGLKAAPLRYEYRPNWPPGSVLLQDPPPGSRILQGAPVTLTINRETGEPMSEYRLELLDLDLAYGLLQREVSVKVPIGDNRFEVYRAWAGPGQRVSVLAFMSGPLPAQVFVDGQKRNLEESP